MNLTFEQAAVNYLEARGKPVHCKEIVEQILELGLVQSRGKTPKQTLASILNTDIRKRKEFSTFVKVSPGVFGLRNWGDVALEENQEILEKIDHKPSIAENDELAIQECTDVEGYFTPKNLEEAKKRITISIVQRRGQPEFRRNLLMAYNYPCAITGCNAEEALEAAHIYSNAKTGINHPSNGLLLRADIHTLFDLKLIAIEPETMTVYIASKLRSTCYGELHGNFCNFPIDKTYLPNKEALKWRYDQREK